MSRVLLSGASGFIGARAIAPLLAAGHEVHAVARSEPPAQLAGVVWHRADLTDASAAQQLVGEVEPELLLHLAWYVEHGRYWQSVENVVWVEATLRLLRAFAGAGGRRAVLAGTCAEYEWTHERYEEGSTPLRPATLYGVAKHATHMVAESFASEAGIELAWGRIFMPYGPGEADARLVGSVTSALLAGREAPLSDGLQARDFMYVEDVGAAFAALLDSSVLGAVNVASGRRCTIGEMATLLARAVGRPELLRLGALPNRAGEPPTLVADVHRLREEVGFSPQVELEEGVSRTVAWWRETHSA
jgi:nucleoside-diphosphate-sugar epimerase